MVLPSGELQIRNVNKEDGKKTYQCRTKHRLTGDTKLSATAGKLVITGKTYLFTNNNIKMITFYFCANMRNCTTIKYKKKGYQILISEQSLYDL